MGVTNDLQRRVFEHKSQRLPGFTKKYLIDQLVYFETTPNINAALAREKGIKAWRREKKVELVERSNPSWRDLSLDWAP
jgi:putative endonuclease